jgi:hypothetical protein
MTIAKLTVLLSLLVLTLSFGAQAQRHGGGHHGGGHHNGGLNQSFGNQCRAELTTRNYRVLQVFNGRGYNQRQSCDDALWSCQRELSYRHAQGRNYQATCNLVSERQVVKQCASSLIGPRGRLIRSFNAQAQGIAGHGVKRKACKKALRKCNRFQMNNGYRRASCVKSSRF